MKRILFMIIISTFGISSFAKEVSIYEQSPCLETNGVSVELSGVSLDFCDDGETPLILNIYDEKSVLVIKKSLKDKLGPILCSNLGHKEFVNLELGKRITCDEESLCSEFDEDGILIPRVSAEVRYRKSKDPLGYYKHEDKDNAVNRLISKVKESMVIEGSYKGGRFLVDQLICKD